VLSTYDKVYRIALNEKRKIILLFTEYPYVKQKEAGVIPAFT